METTNITIEIDKNLKEEATKLFNELGITLSSAIIMFLKEAVKEQRIPFEVSKEEEINYSSKEQLKEFLDKEIKRHKTVYEELAKWLKFLSMFDSYSREI